MKNFDSLLLNVENIESSDLKRFYIVQIWYSFSRFVFTMNRLLLHISTLIRNVQIVKIHLEIMKWTENCQKEQYIHRWICVIQWRWFGRIFMYSLVKNCVLTAIWHSCCWMLLRKKNTRFSCHTSQIVRIGWLWDGYKQHFDWEWNIFWHTFKTIKSLSFLDKWFTTNTSANW